MTPEALLGRVSALLVLTWGARSIEAALGALVGGTLGATWALGAAVGLFAVQGSFCCRPW